MLHLLLGRSGTGKTALLLERMKARGADRPQILIVPEQYSHEVERQLSRVGGPSASRWGEVLSFSRLANRVFTEAGGLAVTELDGGGRILAMYTALKSVAPELRVFARPSRKAAFLRQLIATADELKSCCVSPESLLRAGEQAEGEEAGRLRDLGLIFAAYDAVTAAGAADPRDRLTRMAEKLRTCPFFKGKDVWLDCFTDFTPQERRVLGAILGQAETVTVALTCDGAETGESIFDPARRTAAALRALAAARQTGVKTEMLTGGKRHLSPALARVEAGLFAQTAEPEPGTPEGVTLVEADTPYHEAEYAAGRIRALVRDKGYRFRDIGVAARSIDAYAGAIQAVFPKYGVPVFLSQMTDILQKPILSLVTAALAAATGGYEYDDVFRYLKTGLAGVTPEECDLLENYVLRWDLRGKNWTEERPWSLHPGGYALPWTEEDRALVARLDGLRRRVAAPLEKLRTAPGRDGRALALAVYDFLEEIRLPAVLSARREQLLAEGKAALAEEYRQLWDILAGALEQCASVLDGYEMKLEEFGDLFALVLSQYDVGSIPVALDQVTAADAPRMAHKALRAVFVLGADDGAFPQVSQSPGLLNDDDRVALEGLGFELAPTAQRRLDREMTIAYELFALPGERLWVSWAKSGEDGEEKRPSFLVERLRRLFPDAKVERGPDMALRLGAPQAALDVLGQAESPALRDCLLAMHQWAARTERILRAGELTRGSLSPDGVRAVYGDKVRLSASRLDKLKSCHFSYFMQYGLKAKPRQAAGFRAPEAGTFVHYVLEHVLREAESRGGAAALDRGQVRALTRQAVDQYLSEELGGLGDKTPRFRYLFRRLLRSVDLVVDNVLEELRASRFRPVYFELGFGSGQTLPPVEFRENGVTLSISGFVDRVDGWARDGKLYLRVVDYKTGKKSFDLTDIWHGLGLQMLIYLFALEEKGQPLFHAPLVPAGVLYLPAHDVTVAGRADMDEETRQRAVDSALVRKGVVLDDPGVLDAMETDCQTEGARFLPVKVSKRTGKITGDALVTAEQLGKLRRHIHKVLGDITREMAQGNITADPYYKNALQSACAYCEYAQACQFEEGRGGDRSRYLYPVQSTRFWQELDREETEETK